MKEYITTKNLGGINLHCQPFLPRHVYIEAAGIHTICSMMNRAGYSQLTSLLVPVPLEDRSFLKVDHSMKLPPIGAYVRITQRGLYFNDVGVVIGTPEGAEDLVPISVIPRFNLGKDKKKRGRPSIIPHDTLQELSLRSDFFVYGSRWFHTDGFEFLLAPWTHGMSIVEPSLAGEQLRLFKDVVFRSPTANVDEVRNVSRKWELKQIGKEAAIYAGHMKGWCGRLRDVNCRSATIECPGRNPPFINVPLKEVVLM
jgi:hypothetical protein